MPAPTKQTKRRFGLLDFIRILLVLVILCALGVIAYRLWDYKTGTDRYDQLQQQAVQPVEETQEEGFVPLDIDFDALREEGPDIIGWIDFDSVEISYPIVYSGDNSYYLRRAPDGSHSESGSLFADAFNTAVTDPYVLVYGHHMQDGSMFAGLLAYQDEDFYRSGSGCFTLYTPDGVRRYQIFAMQFADDASPLYSLGFANDEAFGAFLQQVKAGSLYDTGVAVSQEDQVLSLSTCATVSGEG